MRMALFSVALGLALLLAGCSGLLHRDIQADPAVVSDVRGHVNVVAEAQTEYHYDGDTYITKVLIINVDASGIKEAIRETATVLKAHGWREVGIYGAPGPESALLELDGPEKTTAGIWGSDFSISAGGPEPQVLQAFSEASKKIDSGVLLFLGLDGW